MGISDRSVGQLPSHPHPPKLKEIPNPVLGVDNKSGKVRTKTYSGVFCSCCALLWKIMTWCHYFHITLKARHIPGCLNVMSRSNHVQSTELSLHPQVFKQICHKWFTPHVNLFATHLNHNFHSTCLQFQTKILGT